MVCSTVFRVQFQCADVLTLCKLVVAVISIEHDGECNVGFRECGIEFQRSRGCLSRESGRFARRQIKEDRLSGIRI